MVEVQSMTTVADVVAQVREGRLDDFVREAVVLVARGQSELHIHMLIATALGIGLSVLLASALMSLIFLSHRSGHDADAGAPYPESDDQ